jgi:hypothetical protein
MCILKICNLPYIYLSINGCIYLFICVYIDLTGGLSPSKSDGNNDGDDVFNSEKFKKNVTYYTYFYL